MRNIILIPFFKFKYTIYGFGDLADESTGAETGAVAAGNELRDDGIADELSNVSGFDDGRLPNPPIL